MPSPAPSPLMSAANPRVRAAVALRGRRDRDRAGLTLVDGARELRRALDGHAVVTEAFICEPMLAGADARAVLDRLAADGTPIQSVDERIFAKLAFGDRAEGIVAVVRIPSIRLEDLVVPDDPMVIVLERLEKPGNVGAVLRSADGARADAVLLADARTDPFNPNAIRASAGTVFSLPLAADSTLATLGWVRRNRLRIVAARVDAGHLYTETDLRGPLALVLGAETDGLSPAWAGPDVEAVRLPMLGVADSLNVSVCAAILLYEARRQRGLSGETV